MKIRISFFCVLSLSAMMFFSCRPTKDRIDRGVIADSAMVVSAHPLASAVGKKILNKGGNAVDAAIAVHMALAVVYPEAGNIGGGGFFVIRDNQSNYYSLDFREKSPIKSSRDMYLDQEGEPIPEKSQKGHLAAGVPGAVDGMITAFEKFGSLPWEDLVQPAVELAGHGFELSEAEAEKFNLAAEGLNKYSTINPQQFTGKKWEKGDIFIQSQLAETLQLIRDHKREGFYTGKVADFILAEMERGEGIISQQDLDNYKSEWREPLIGNYKGHTLITMGPPSSGGIILMQMLRLLEELGISPSKEDFADYLHLKTEMERRIYADRAAYMADADFFPVPVKELLDKDYLLNRFQDFDPNKATPSSIISAGKILPVTEETTHFSIVDSKGNAVSCTTTLNGFMGSSVVVAGAGFILNNEMDDFSIKPGFPNMYGVLGGEANKIEPEKRMLSSMTPTIIEKENNLFMVVGTPGGSTIPTSVFQTIVNVIDFGMGMQEAVNQGRYHSQWYPEVVFYEKGQLGESTRTILEEKGHRFTERGSIGRVDAILRLENGKYEGGADPRGMDTAEGF